MRAVWIALGLAAWPQMAGAETGLDQYRGQVSCRIEHVCRFEKACAPNDWRLKSFDLDFRDDGQVLIAFGGESVAALTLFLPRPTPENGAWWNFAWMSGGPNTLQIGPDHVFTLIQGPVERLGLDTSPPIVFTGTCAP